MMIMMIMMILMIMMIIMIMMTMIMMIMMIMKIRCDELHDMVDDDDSRWCPGSVILLLVLSWTRIPSSTVIIITVINLDGHEHG